MRKVLLLLMVFTLFMACRYDVLEQPEETIMDDFSATTTYPLSIPPFFPPMDIPADNPFIISYKSIMAKVEIAFHIEAIYPIIATMLF